MRSSPIANPFSGGGSACFRLIVSEACKKAHPGHCWGIRKRGLKDPPAAFLAGGDDLNNGGGMDTDAPHREHHPEHRVCDFISLRRECEL